MHVCAVVNSPGLRPFRRKAPVRTIWLERLALDLPRVPFDAAAVASMRKKRPNDVLRSEFTV